MSGDGDQQFREIFACQIIGKDLFNEINRNKFMRDENYAKILWSRSIVLVLRDLLQ